jgi:Holliday junction resolvasome RuvABC DNA-binding subunit
MMSSKIMNDPKALEAINTLLELGYSADEVINAFNKINEL